MGVWVGVRERERERERGWGKQINFNLECSVEFISRIISPFIDQNKLKDV